MSRRWARPSMMSSPATNRCAPYFPTVDGVPFQEVLPARAGMWRRGGAAVVSLPEQDVAGELVALAGYRFDLSAEIPIRAQIYAVGPEQYVVGIVVHHIAFDGWSHGSDGP